MTAANITLDQLNVSLVGFGATGQQIQINVKKLYKKPATLIGKPHLPKLHTAGGSSLEL